MSWQKEQDEKFYRHLVGSVCPTTQDERHETSTTRDRILRWVIWIAIATLMVITLVSASNAQASVVTECSFYTVASTIKEGTGNGIGLTASGEILKDDGEFTCAHPTEAFWQRLLITNKFNGRQIVARCNDRGPATRLRRLGRSLDVNKSAAKALGILESGIAMVEIARVK